MPSACGLLLREVSSLLAGGTHDDWEGYAGGDGQSSARIRGLVVPARVYSNRTAS